MLAFFISESWWRWLESYPFKKNITRLGTLREAKYSIRIHTIYREEVTDLNFYAFKEIPELLEASAHLN